jgi:hypothetical protein
MSIKTVARKQAGWLVVSILPDVCKTPVGGTPVPVPYPVVAKLEDATDVVSYVKANGHPVVVFDRSKVPTTLGDQPGKALGIKSNTVGGVCYPKDHSPSVFADGRWLVREGDKFWMNG